MALFLRYFLSYASTWRIAVKQALQNSCELLTQKTQNFMEINASSWNCMHQAKGTSCMLIELHASSLKYMQAHRTACKFACKLMELYTSSWHGSLGMAQLYEKNCTWIDMAAQ